MSDFAIRAPTPETFVDLVLPHNAAGLSDRACDIAAQASPAWIAAVCWDDDYAKARLAEVRP